MPIVEFKGDKIKFPDHMMDEEIKDVIEALSSDEYEPTTEVGRRAQANKNS